MASIPRDPMPDATLPLWLRGYDYAGQRFEHFQTSVFRTRLLLRPVLVARGREAARMFYRPGRFTRVGAMPATAQTLLQDRGSVQTLSGAAHWHRKQLFLTLLDEPGRRRLVELMDESWQQRIGQWQRQQRVVLHDEVQGMLLRAACHWCGIEVTGDEAEKLTRACAAMIHGAGSVGPEQWRAQWLRQGAEHWARRQIRQFRRQWGGPVPDSLPQGTPLARLATHRDLNGELLSETVAGVELLNLLRPVVAVARFVVFAALALAAWPEQRRALRGGEEGARERFVQEVRRYYPFFPLIGGRVRQRFHWRGQAFEPGAWVVLDLYGSNHDPELWERPEQFCPERFRHWQDDGFSLIPQGGGGVEQGHRCPGETLTLELLGAAVDWLVGGMEYVLPEQDLSVSLRRMPALPASGLVLSEVRARRFGGECPARPESPSCPRPPWRG